MVLAFADALPPRSILSRYSLCTATFSNLYLNVIDLSCAETTETSTVRFRRLHWLQLITDRYSPECFASTRATLALPVAIILYYNILYYYTIIYYIIL